MSEDWPDWLKNAKISEDASIKIIAGIVNWYGGARDEHMAHLRNDALPRWLDSSPGRRGRVRT